MDGAVEPHSGRVQSLPQTPLAQHDPSAPPLFTSIVPSPTSKSPPIPPRSPLRPTPKRSLPSLRAVIEAQSEPNPLPPSSELTPESSPEMPLLPTRSFSDLLESFTHRHSAMSDKEKDKILPLPPTDLSLTFPLSPVDIVDGDNSSTSSLPLPKSDPARGPSLSKREHALLELLSSERAYASDLALIRDIHIPLALGQPTPFVHPASPPGSSGSSSRTLSTASDSSAGSGLLGPPMTREDVRIIFSNVAELAVFADSFSEQLEHALGSVLSGGQGEDSVGRLFVDIIPLLEPPYKTYITRHPTALSHLNDLPQTPALTAYLSHTRTLASSLTHAWDLPSLLIKPVQRLLKYPLLLSTILEETPEGHSDKARLRSARDRMEEVARAVNEGRRRAEVVKEVLTGIKLPDALSGSKKKGGASVTLARMRSLKLPRPKEENEEAERVAALEQAVKRCSTFIQDFAKAAVEWRVCLRESMVQLRVWAVSFGQVIGLSPEQPSEAFDAFLAIIDDQLMPLCDALEMTIQEKYLPELGRLVDTTRAPLRLLSAMHALEPMHHALLNTNLSKNRPPAALVDASQSYLALRGQLCTELPEYLALLGSGTTSAVIQLARWQAQFWGDVRERWGELWDALRVEGEMNAGAAETLRVWWRRWAEVDQAVSMLTIVRREKLYVRPVPAKTSAVMSVLSALEPPRVSPLTSPSTSSPPQSAFTTMSSVTTSMTSSQSSQSSAKKRAVVSMEAGYQQGIPQRPSVDNLHGQVLLDDYEPWHPGRPGRSYSSPQTIRRAASSSQALDSHFPRSPPQPYVERDDLDLIDHRGRSSRKASLKQKLSDTLRPMRQRSASRKSLSSASPTVGAFPDSVHSSNYTTRPTITRHSPSMYACKVVHPCDPPEGTSYLSLPFFQLRVRDVFEVLSEAGHPSTHEGLPLYVDDGEDCLLIVRDKYGEIGWALASFLMPLA